MLLMASWLMESLRLDREKIKEMCKMCEKRVETAIVFFMCTVALITCVFLVI